MSSYAELRAEWYARLAADGFQDIEKPDGTLMDRGRLAYARSQSPAVRSARAAYYSAAAAYLHETPWADLLERRIWALHAEGETVRAIAEQVGQSKDYVQRRVTCHRLAMRLNRPLEPREECAG
jgi:hypothetical protein